MRRCGVRQCAPQLSFLKQVDLIGANLFRSKLVRRTTEMLCKRLHNLQVGVYGSLRVIPTLELFDRSQVFLPFVLPQLKMLPNR